MLQLNWRRNRNRNPPPGPAVLVFYSLANYLIIVYVLLHIMSSGPGPTFASKITKQRKVNTVDHRPKPGGDAATLAATSEISIRSGRTLMLLHLLPSANITKTSTSTKIDPRGMSRMAVAADQKTRGRATNNGNKNKILDSSAALSMSRSVGTGRALPPLTFKERRLLQLEAIERYYRPLVNLPYDKTIVDRATGRSKQKKKSKTKYNSLGRSVLGLGLGRGLGTAPSNDNDTNADQSSAEAIEIDAVPATANVQTTIKTTTKRSRSKLHLSRAVPHEKIIVGDGEAVNTTTISKPDGAAGALSQNVSDSSAAPTNAAQRLAQTKLPTAPKSRSATGNETEPPEPLRTKKPPKITARKRLSFEELEDLIKTGGANMELEVDDDDEDDDDKNLALPEARVWGDECTPDQDEEDDEEEKKDECEAYTTAKYGRDDNTRLLTCDENEKICLCAEDDKNMRAEFSKELEICLTPRYYSCTDTKMCAPLLTCSKATERDYVKDPEIKPGFPKICRLEINKDEANEALRNLRGRQLLNHIFCTLVLNLISRYCHM